jgi:transposase
LGGVTIYAIKYIVKQYCRNSKETGYKFNYVHSSFRSVIERTFGVWKNRWHVLRQMPSYDINDQMLIVVAIVVLHNFIRIHDRKDKGFKWDEDNFDNDDDAKSNG